MSNKNIYEVFNEFKKAKSKSDRLKVLKNNDTKALRDVLFGAFHPAIQFTIETIPEYRREKIPPGMSYSNMPMALDRIYLFMKDNPRTPEGLTEKRKNEILIQILEALEEDEATVFENLLKKDLKVPYLTEALINEAFPGLLPQS